MAETTNPTPAKHRPSAEERLKEVQAAGGRVGYEELTLTVAAKLKIPHSAAREAVGAVFDAVIDALATQRREVTLQGFGSFKIKHREARKVRNPQSKDPSTAYVDAPACTYFRWKPGNKLEPIVDPAK